MTSLPFFYTVTQGTLGMPGFVVLWALITAVRMLCLASQCASELHLFP